ncbi:MAG: sensor histidine kinase [gamma proteobacterium symbiont of Phacoides pectinatus]
MNSLKRRLQLGLGLTLVALIGLIWLIGNQTLRAMSEGFVASRLEHDAQGLLASMRFGPEGTELSWRHLSEVYSQPFSGHYFVIRFSDGTTLRSRSLWDQTLDIPHLPPGQAARHHVAGPDAQTLLLLTGGYRKGGREFTLGVAEDLTPILRERDRYSRWFALLALGGLGGLLLIQSLVVNYSFRRLERVRREVQQLALGQASQLSEEVPAEVLPLVREFNQLLGLLNQRLGRSRNALGNLAHALKGPLNLLTQYFDQPDEPGRRDRAAHQTRRIGQLMERELKRARLAGKHIASSRFEPDRELPELIAVLQQIHGPRGLRVTYRAPPGILPAGEREDMLELLGNLLDNACKWAATRVHCRIEADTRVRIRVEDDGDGLDPSDIERLTDRGTRLDERTEGHGLGLAIVSDIVKLYGGTLRFSRAGGLGGLRVEVELPGA